MKVSARRWGLLVALVAVTGGFSYGGWRLWRALSYRAALTEIRGQIDEKRHAIAARNLSKVLVWEPGSDEAAYLLGLCEKALGRTDKASQVWARVPAGSRYATLAVVGRAALQVDEGRFADAENLINQTLNMPRVDGFDLRRFLTPLFWHEGRLEEARRLVQKNWSALDGMGRGGSTQALELVRLHILLGMGKSSLDALNSFLERAAGLAPDDDRVWLGKANLAIRNGEFDEASRLLVLCLRRRPRDAPVLHARLTWAVATGHVDVARECLALLPAEDCAPGEVYKFAAWLAEKRRDARSERRALELLIATDPADGAALDRLAVLADRENQPSRAAELRGRKTELDQVNSRYKELFLRDQALRDAEEMARLAERLGRLFEAKVFWSVASAAEPDRADLQKALAELRQRQAPVGEPGQTAAEMIASRLDNTGPTAPP
jgi:enediyne biosynthesis protein E4